MEKCSYKVQPSKKSIYWAEIMFFLVMWVIAVFNYSNADYESYRLIYDYYIPNGTGLSVMPDIGYYVLCVVGIHVGLSFQTFRGIYITLALFFFVKGFSYFAENKRNIYWLYLFFPFLMEVVQYRFFMASAIMLFALKYLKEKKYKTYVICVILAALQHSSAIAYLLFLLCVSNENTLKYRVAIITLSETGVFLLAPTVLNSILGRFIPQLAIYLSSDSYTRKLYFIFIAIEILLLIWIEKVQIQPDTEIVGFNKKLVWIVMCFIPFVIIDDNFVRLYRGTMPIVYSAIYLQMEKHRDINWKNIVAILLCALLFYVFLSQHSTTNWNNITKPLFENNYFFDFLRL